MARLGRYMAGFAVCALFAAIAAADEPRAKGFVPSAFVPSAMRVESNVKSRARLRAADNDSLQPRWDSREHGWVTPVKSQGGVGACWAFATYAVLEAQLLKAGKGEYDFSEKNMVNLNGFMGEPDDGGDYFMSEAYLLRWGGAVAETNDVYVKNITFWTPSPVLSPIAHVQNVIWLPGFGSYAGAANELKTAIRDYGAVGVAIGWDNSCESSNTYYNANSSDLNHAIAVVGWDDDFPASAFVTTAPSDGAWLIKNSWGRNYGDAGYYWVSYCDRTFCRGSTPTVFIPAGDDENYDVVRGYDRLGCTYDVTQAYSSYAFSFYDLQASVFTSSWNEELAAVGVYSSFYPNPYEILVYTNVTKGAASPEEGGVLACRQTGSLEHAGFTTIHLDIPIALADTNSFAVVYRQTGDWRSTCVSCSYVGICNPTNHPGNCYVGYVTEAGTNVWLDAYYEAYEVDQTDEGWAMCIKAYTRFTASAPTSDAPAENDDGSQMMAELESDSWSWFHETGETFGAAAGMMGANGRSLWTSWFMGLDWTSPTSNVFKASIDMIDGKPSVTWDPDLGGKRTYTVLGRISLGDEIGWFAVDPADPSATGAKFFKVSIGK